MAQKHESWETLHHENLFVEENATQRESKRVFTALQAESSDLEEESEEEKEKLRQEMKSL